MHIKRHQKQDNEQENPHCIPFLSENLPVFVPVYEGSRPSRIGKDLGKAGKKAGFQPYLDVLFFILLKLVTIAHCERVVSSL
ncbi:hypothetical protein [Brevibacillus sp. SIMBA_040]|uniref:hypothetical protein n=1 Tax=unclassified Brevibacillus TaxID=2684853 RepID=UPI00397C991E